MNITPLHLEIFIHHYISDTPFPRDSDVVRWYRDDLLNEGFLEIRNNIYIPTEKGLIWLDKILETPYPIPVLKWGYKEKEKELEKIK